jgi:ComF family protein
MQPFYKTAYHSVMHIFFPHNCAGCGTDVLQTKDYLCLRCFTELPVTNFNTYNENLVEKIFWGRVPIASAAAMNYFAKDSVVQKLLHQLKYKNNQPLGFYMGRIMGHWLLQSTRFNNIDVLVPLPLFAAKEKKRGYNQSTILCNGLTDVLQKPVLANAVKRLSATETQTNKTRTERWENMQSRFCVENVQALKNKHVLLVDDVVTTGATLESCGQEILNAGAAHLSIVTFAYTIK